MEVREKYIEGINFKLLVSVELRTPIILGCDVASLGKESPNFRGIILLSFKVGKSCVGDPITHLRHVITQMQ
jgi:hypothetical protein